MNDLIVVIMGSNVVTIFANMELAKDSIKLSYSKTKHPVRFVEAAEGLIYVWHTDSFGVHRLVGSISKCYIVDKVVHV